MKKPFKFLKGLFKVAFKILRPKWIAIAIVALVLLAIILYGVGLGIGKGVGNEKGDGNTKIETSQTEMATEENDVLEESTEKQNENLDNALAGEIIEITVLGNEYIFENRSIELDEFIDQIKQEETNVTVYVLDENASLTAYNALIDQLEENKIGYTEK
jgi:hypothetical protein